MDAVNLSGKLYVICLGQHLRTSHVGQAHLSLYDQPAPGYFLRTTSSKRFSEHRNIPGRYPGLRQAPEPFQRISMHVSPNFGAVFLASTALPFLKLEAIQLYLPAWPLSLGSHCSWPNEEQ